MKADGRSLAGRRILVVEDNVILAETLAMALEAEGAEIAGPADSVKAALELVAEDNRLDGAILDVNLHGELVYPVAEELQTRGMPFVLLTGESSIPAGFAGVPCLRKPAAVKHLIQALFG